MTGAYSVAVPQRKERTMDRLIKHLSKTAPFQGDLDYKLIRASMVIIYFFFGYQKWFDYEMQGLIPFFTHGPLISWMYPVFGMKGSTYLLGVSERSEEHTSELQSLTNLVCRLLLEKKKTKILFI